MITQSHKAVGNVVSVIRGMRYRGYIKRDRGCCQCYGGYAIKNGRKHSVISSMLYDIMVM